MKYLLAILVLALPLRGQVVTFQGEPKKEIEASGKKISIFPRAEVLLPDDAAPGLSTSLNLTGAGIRVKRILFIHINAYVIASYVEEVKKIDKENPLPGIKKSKVKVLHLTFLRNIGAGSIIDAFSESMKKNGFDLENPRLKIAFQRLNHDVPEGGTMTLTAYPKANGEEAIVFSGPAGESVSTGKDIAEIFWSIWFGIPSDGQMENLKKELMAENR